MRLLYSLTAIGRPVDPAWPSNRALLALLPVAALAGAGMATTSLSVVDDPVTAALRGALALFGGWAVTRELAPDDDAAAFVSAALAWVAAMLMTDASLLPLFAALVIARVVNRTTGLPVMISDAVLVCGFVVWVTVTLGKPLVGIASALAFALDVRFDESRRWPLIPAAACLVAAVYAVIGTNGVTLNLAPAPTNVATLIALLGFVAVIVRTRALASVCDVEGKPLSAARVRGGMAAVAIAAAGYFLQTPGAAAGAELPLIACLAGALLGRLRPLRRPP